jgi:GNAT superfamily N-acetyltransferase
MVRSTTGNAPDRLDIVPAREEDVDLVIEILNEAAEWLESIGFPTRWNRAQLSREKFLSQILQNEVFLAKLGNETVGTITLQWSDPVFWDGASADAGYVHKFTVRRAYAGRKFGEAMLQWAENEASRRGKKYLRLDCLSNNRKIREYYERTGFVHKGDASPLGWRASLYEKRL